MGDIAFFPEGIMLPVKEESPDDTGVAGLPLYASMHEAPAQFMPAPTFTSGSFGLRPVQDMHGLKPEADGLPVPTVPPSAAAATISSAAISSDVVPATPYSFPATPPQDFSATDFAAPKELSATALEVPAALPVAELIMNDTPPDSASEPPSEPQVRPRRIRPEFIPARRTPFPCSDSEDDDYVINFSSRRGVRTATAFERARAAHPARTSRTAQAPETAGAHADAVASTTSANDSTSDTSTNSANADPPRPASRLVGHDTPEQHTEPLRPPEPSASADDTIASRRPVRMARLSKGAAPESPNPDRRASRATAKPAAKQIPTLGAAASASRSARKPAAAAPVERRVTRFSGLPSELAAPRPSLGKRRRSESDKYRVAALPRELRRLQDTKEFSHVDEQPVVYTVWSNGKYVPANAAGEPLTDTSNKTKAAKPADAQDRKDGEAGPPPTAAAEDEAADAPRVVQKRVKKWLTKGLYAGQAMPENPTMGLTAAEKRQLAKLPELSKEYPSNKALPMPIFNGLRMLIQGRDFKMPFDVFNPLPPGQPKPVKYGRFSKNRFVGEAHAIWKKNPHYDDFQSKCVCKPETGCDEDCQNRIMLYECNDMICNVGAERCSNREFQQLTERSASKNPYHIGVEVFKTPNRGHGIRANRTFRPGQIIMEYIGEIITEEESDRRMNELYKNNACYYLMSFDQSLIIDGTSGSIARFVNHSCSPNCRMIKWIVSGQPRIALFAGDRPIMTGEELTYDYNFDPYSAKNVQSCLCGSENCRGILGPRKSEKAVSKAAAEKAAEKAAAEKSKTKPKDKAASQSKPATGAGKRRHDAYSMDDEGEPASSGPAAKKMRMVPSQPRPDEPAKKTPAAKPVTTTKAALEALAAGAARQARLAKAVENLKLARAAKVAKATRAAEAMRATEAKKKAALAKLAKATSSAKKASAASAKSTKATGSARSTKSTAAAKATKPGTVVKAAKAVKAAKLSSAATAKAKAARLQKPTATKTGQANKGTATASAKSLKSAKTAAAKAKPSKLQKPKASLVPRSVTPIHAAGTANGGDVAVVQASPMAQAVAKAAKEAAKMAKAANSATAAKKAVVAKASVTARLTKGKSGSGSKTTKTTKTTTTATVKTTKTIKLVKASGPQSTKTQSKATQANKGPAKTMGATEPATSIFIKTKKTPAPPAAVADIPGEADEVAAQLRTESAAGDTSDAPKPQPARRAPGRPQKHRVGAASRPSDAMDLDAAPATVAGFDDLDSDEMALDSPAGGASSGTDSAQDVIHVAPRSGHGDLLA